MSKKEISYTGLVKVMMDKAREEAKNLGKDFDNKAAFSAAAKRWSDVKNGNDPEFTKGDSPPRKSRKKKPLPGHKGAPSKTRPGHEDFRTAKGFKYYHRDGHLEDYNREGVKGKPYSHYNKKVKTPADVLKLIDHCLEKEMSLQECRDKVAASISGAKTAKRGKKGKRGTRKKGKKGKKSRK